MSDELKPYPEYKESSAPWLGRVPAHWDVRRNGGLFAQRNETGFKDLPILEVSLKTGVRVRDMDDGARKQVMSDRDKYKRAAKGDLAYNMMRMWQGAAGVVPTDGLVSPAYVVARPFAGADSRYFAYLFRTDVYLREVDSYSRGIVKDRHRLYWESFKQMPSCVPSPDEQRAIANVLDANAVQVNRFIRNRRRLIEVLNEQKRAMIRRAVTRGLDETAPLKASGVEWLGEVPAHWTVASLRLRYDQCLGKMVDAKQATGKHLIPYLRNVDVKWDHINTTDLPLIDIKPEERDRFTVRPGDLLVCEGRHLGRAAFWSGDIPVCGFQKALHRLRPYDAQRDDARFLFYCLYVCHVVEAFDARSDDNSIPHLTGEMLRAHRFPFPPTAEQRAIVKHLDRVCGEIGRALATAEREIALIREYRTRLIADVVTGKVDVRGIAPPAEAEADNMSGPSVEAELENGTSGDDLEPVELEGISE